MPDMTRWLAGAEKPSMGTFLKVIDILIEQNQTSAEREQRRAERSQTKADLSQARADRDQATADRDQAKADRHEAKADREQHVGRIQDGAHIEDPSGQRTERLRLVQPNDSDSASSTPDKESGKKSAG
jgi:hypothetical protein